MTSRFVTPYGVEVAGITTEQMREVDRIAISETGPNLFQMMENAGRSTAEVSMHWLREHPTDGPVVVLAGTGGNGGGVICAARHLANRGVDVDLVLSDESRLSEVPRAQLDIYRFTPGRISDLTELNGVAPALVIDGVIGYSLHGAARGRALALIEWSLRTEAEVLSLDVPSGIDATTGGSDGAYVLPALTLTLALPKTGLGPGAGDLFLADLGIPASVYAMVGIEVPDELFAGSFLVPISPMP